MTDHQYIAHLWLSRMWDKDIEINQLEVRRDKIISSLSGIGNYDSDRIPSAGNDNGTETKNIEYSLLSGQIEKKVSDISKENVRTIDTIDNVKDPSLRGILYAWYINRLHWREVGKLYNIEKTQVYRLRNRELNAVFEYIPVEEVEL